VSARNMAVITATRCTRLRIRAFDRTEYKLMDDRMLAQSSAEAPGSAIEFSGSAYAGCSSEQGPL
jgi:hypothetical protein